MNEMNFKNSKGNIIFRASGSHALLTNAKGNFTQSNQNRIDELEGKKLEVVGITTLQAKWLAENTVDFVKDLLTEKQNEKFNKLTAQQTKLKELTENQAEELKELIEKKNKPFELSETAKTFIQGCWLINEYGYKEPFVTKETLKGNMMENDSIKLAVDVLGIKDWVSSNKKRKSNEYFTGEWDAVVESLDEVWEIKTCFNLRTYMNKKNVEDAHKTQVNIYGDLLEKKKLSVIYCLVKTPPILMEEIIKSFWFKFGCDDENLDYQKIRVQLMHNNDIIDSIPKEQRIKKFNIDWDEEQMNELKNRIDGPAQDYYHTITIDQIDLPEQSEEVEETESNGEMAF